MRIKSQLIKLAEEMISQTGGFGSISLENREEIQNYIGLFGSKIDELIHTFYHVNCKIDNGGAPILKQIISEFDYYEVSLVRETACLMLNKGIVTIDYTFINHFEFESTTREVLIEIAKSLAAKNNVIHFAINFD